LAARPLRSKSAPTSQWVTALFAFVGPEFRVNEVREATQHVQRLALAGRVLIRDCAFDQMAGIVHLMPIAQVTPAHVGLHHREIGIQVAIWLLRPRHAVDQIVGQAF
jgi:hypothetical protein